SVPSESVAKARSPTSRPAFSAEGGKGFGSHSTLNTAYQFPASRLTVTILILPSIGRCSLTLTAPTPCKRNLPLSSILQPSPSLGKVTLSYRLTERNRG